MTQRMLCKTGISVSANSFSIFFFSSRRRHTRWTGDWSSDVCSSDLTIYARGFGVANLDHNVPVTPETAFDIGSISKQRSEERRVGKECRSRWPQDHEKKKLNNIIAHERDNSGIHNISDMYDRR